MQPRKLKRVVIKEELVELTGDFQHALVLNQMLYWSERIADFDKFVEEERKRMMEEGEPLNMPESHGWIYKKAEELSEELMLKASHQTIRRILKELVKNEWLLERRNPNHKWDRTLQYRVNIKKIQMDLNTLGYALEGYELAMSKMDNGISITETSMSKMDIQESEMDIQSVTNGRAIPEITTEITTENTNKALQAGGEMDLCQGIRQMGIPVTVDVIKSLLQKYDKERILDNARHVSNKNHGQYRNTVSVFVKAVVENYAIDSTSMESKTDSQAIVKTDDRYAEWYKLFPNNENQNVSPTI